MNSDGFKEVTIQQQHLDYFGNTYYDEIFKIKLEKMELKELILVESLFKLDSTTEIIELIDIQPSNKLFFTSYMELDKMNMIMLLCFDGRIVSKLLERLSGEHSSLYPMFYKMMFTSPSGTT